MATILLGNINLARRLREHPVWQRADYGYAWVDLLMLANDQPRRAFINGVPYDLQRGQLLWSKRSLELAWHRSDTWVTTFLNFCRDEGMIKVDSNKRRTIITILNYDAYNLPKNGTEQETETATEQETEVQWKGEVGNGKRKGERASAPTEKAFSEIPSDEDIQCFCANYRDLGRGVDKGIGEVWWRGWLASFSRSNRPFPNDWKRALKDAFTADIVARHPKAMLALSGTQGLEAADSKTTGQTSDSKKNAGPKNAARPDGRTMAQARFELQRELEALTERLDAAHEIGAEPNPRDVKREKELKNELSKL